MRYKLSSVGFPRKEQAIELTKLIEARKLAQATLVTIPETSRGQRSMCKQLIRAIQLRINRLQGYVDPDHPLVEEEE